MPRGAPAPRPGQGASELPGLRWSRRLTTALIAGAMTLVGGGVHAPAAPAAPAASAASATGVTELRPGKGVLQRAVDAASPGDVLALHAGTYPGQVFIRRSGTATAPITIRPFGDGAVTLTASFDVADCGATRPNVRRTLMLRDGVDHWTIQGLRIVNGVWVSGTGFSAAAEWIKLQAKESRNWTTRRSLPGRGYVDGETGVPRPDKAGEVYAALAEVTGAPVEPATGIRILDNDISGRGVHVAVGEHGEIAGNTIHDIDCGIGPAIWLNTYSDFWTITGNHVARVADSTWLHYMQEGIRTGSASSYNVIAHNTVTELPGDGRGITTDIDASFNRFEHNTVTNAAIGLNDQQSGWGNYWGYNAVSGMRGASMVFRGADAKLRSPSYNSSTLKSTVECNVTTGGLTAGALMYTKFVNNTFRSVNLSDNLKTYWSQYGNTWNGSTRLPPQSPPKPQAGACPSPGA